MVFLETERYALDPLAGDIWILRSTQVADFPTTLDVLRITRAVNAHAAIFLSRHTAPRMKFSFLGNMSPPFRTQRGSSTRVRTPKACACVLNGEDRGFQDS